jgi:peptidoglycan/xylan/chitin deacetylase (PgdA/CDA1 family)
VSFINRVLMLAARPGLSRKPALSVARLRSRSLVLLYHRVVPDGTADAGIIPTVTRTHLRQHIDVLQRLGRIVPLSDLVLPSSTTREIRFAITFDDDDRAHAKEALPVLVEKGVPATFFLSGRQLHGRGPYWWDLLQAVIEQKGLEYVRRQLGVHGESPRQIAEQCEGTPLIGKIESLAGDFPVDTVIDGEEILRLSVSGMEIGFHTVQHPVLVNLEGDRLDEAVSFGCRELSAFVGRPVDLLAYPHGRADDRVALAARRAGYRAAFVTGGRPVSARADNFLLGRWEPGRLTPEEFEVQVALRLNRPVHA